MLVASWSTSRFWYRQPNLECITFRQPNAPSNTLQTLTNAIALSTVAITCIGSKRVVVSNFGSMYSGMCVKINMASILQIVQQLRWVTRLRSIKFFLYYFGIYAITSRWVWSSYPWAIKNIQEGCCKKGAEL